MNNKLTIGLFGFGVVGEGIYQVINETPSLNASVKKICIKDPSKKRSAPQELFTTDAYDILNDEEINVVVELIDNSDAATSIVTAALQKKKAVVSANKKMIAENISHLLGLQKEHDVPFLYEAAVCGSIPVIRNLEEYYDNDMLKGLCGIVNGSTNYILTKMIVDGLTYNEALRGAQQLGFAESNPELDVTGRDAVNKLTILLLHAYGIKTNPDAILYNGINLINAQDTVYAAEKNYKIKLIARASSLGGNKIAAYVLPHFVCADSQLYNVNNEYNGMVIESKLADKQFLCGKGAGRFPTSSAVLSDIAALRYDYRYEYRKLQGKNTYEVASNFYLKVYVSFDYPNDVNKWDFEWIEEFHSTEDRQHLIGVIHFEKLRDARWLLGQNVSAIVMPDNIIEKDTVVRNKLKKVSLQLAGVS